MDAIQVVGVIGAGTMGAGIAQVFACRGYDVLLCETERRFLDHGLKSLRVRLERDAAKGKISTEEANAAFGRVTGILDIERLAMCDFVVEAATEKFEVKQAIFAELDRITRKEIILASNTSSISIARLASATERPDRVIGMHFFNPVPTMNLVEVVCGAATGQETCNQVCDLACALGKTPVKVNDAPGFVSNRVLVPMLNEAMYAVMEGVATPEAVDTIFQLGMAHPMGPLALADFIGLDVCLDILRVLQEGFQDPKYRPCPLLVQMVDEGRLGRKSGQGFYRY